MPEPVHAWKFLNQPIFAQETATNPAKKRLRVFGGLGGECFATLERLDQIRRWICVPFAHGWPLRSPPGWRRPRLQVSRMACGNGGPAIMPEQSPNGRNRPQKAIVTPSSTLARRSEEHTSELQSLMRISYAVYCLKKKKKDS